jgi:hypothetical protein
MFSEADSQPTLDVVPLCYAVFCLDCEAISNTPRDECPSCKGHSLVSLARMLGGSILGQSPSRLGQCASLSFDITITVGLQQMHAEDLNTALERLSTMVGPRLGRARASVHIDVEPKVDDLLPKTEEQSPTEARRSGDGLGSQSDCSSKGMRRSELNMVTLSGSNRPDD